jgi:hypothetical protein
MRSLLGSAWRWSWIPCLLFLATFGHWAMQTWRQFADFGVRVDPTPYAVSLYDSGVLQCEHLLRSARLRLSPGDPLQVAPDLQLRPIELFVAEDQLARLDAELPYSGLQEYVRGQMPYGGQLHEVDVRYRGDTIPHWGYFKKSFRIKTKKDALFEGMQQFNLIAAKFPEQLNNFLAYELARAMGLIVPHVELVNVWLNGRYHGLYELTEQLTEGTLRSHDRMPGDLYAGELVMLDAFGGVTNNLFDYPLLWAKIAANNHYDVASKLPLQRLCAVLASNPSPETHVALGQLLDLDRMALFSAFELLTQTHHYDTSHNWRLYWDPWRTRFEAVVWDPVGWHTSMFPAPGAPIDFDPIYCQLHEWLHGNADFLRARHRHLAEFFATKEAAFLATVDRAIRAARAALEFDPNAMPQDDGAIAAALQQLRDFLGRVLRDLRRDYVDGDEQLHWAIGPANESLRLAFRTRRPTDAIEIQFDGPVRPTRVVVSWLQDRTPASIDLTDATSWQGGTAVVPVQLISALQREFDIRGGVMQNRTTRRRVATSTCELRVEGANLAKVVAVRARRGDAARAIARTGHIDLRSIGELFSFAQPLHVRPQVWTGEVRVDGVREVMDPVHILPGTTIVLAPEASIVFRNRVLAEGTPEAPIRFAPASNEAPWGTVALNDPACRGSVFRWCSFRFGSGHKEPLVEYSSMFSVHNCKDVMVQDCTFQDSKVVDDMVHVMYAEAWFDRCQFENALMDMVDFDISRCVVTRCTFRRSANDGLDLMTTQALVHDCTFDRNGDKGISIGEGSSLVALRNRFLGCNTAMEAKDGSIGYAANCELRNCKTVLNAYLKNWRYGHGGDLVVAKSLFAGNGAMPTCDRESRVELLDCQVDSVQLPASFKDPVDPTRSSRNHARITDCDSGTAPVATAVLPFPPALRHVEDLCGDAWRTLRADFRGVPDAR